jgi:hypothetical protein
MAQLTGLKWDELDGSTRLAISWALSAQGDHVSSRGLLVGMLLADPDGPPTTLLAHFGVATSALLDALAKRVRVRPIDATLPLPGEAIDEPPPLTTNTSDVLAQAAGLRQATRAGQIDIACVFGALLQTPRCVARQTLADVLGEDVIEQVSRHYLDWLLDPDRSAYADALALAFPREPPSASRRPATKGRDTPDPDGPWPFLAVMRRHAPADGPARFRATGLGFVGRDGTLVTTARSAALADALAHLPLGDSEHEFRTLIEGDPLVSLALTPPPVDLLSTFYTTALPGQPCRVATIDDQFLDITLLDGVVADADDPSEGFTVELNTPLSEDRAATGSPVVDADFNIIGIVGPTGTNRSVDAYGSAAIGRVLPAAEPTPTPAPPPPATGTLSGAGNDIVGDVDQLKFGTYVSAFADLITSVHTQPPLTIGIFGSWGMGKSFLLTHIEREIERRQAKNPHAVPKVHVVRFNAWEYSSMDVVWPALVRTIVSRLDKLSTWPWYRRLWTRVRWNLARQWRQLWPRLVAGAIVVAALIVAAVMSGEDNVAKAIGGVAAALGVAGVLKAAKDPVANWVTTLFADSDYGDQLRVMKDIKHDLTSLEERLHATDASGEDVVTGRILILIDDLDRCEPGKAVEVLQALNLLLNFNSFVVVLGIDARIVTGAIEKHYEGLLGKAGASGYEYLDKIVQIPFRIPEPAREEVISFVAGQLGNPKAPEPPPARERPDHEPKLEPAPPRPPDDKGYAGDPGDGDQREPPPTAERSPGPGLPTAADAHPPEVPFTYDEQQAFALFADQLRPNPRHLKRLVNVYRLVRALAQAQEEPLILARPAATIRWLVMWSQWPYASLRMVDRYEQLFDQHGLALAANVAVDEPMLHLLDHVEQGLDADMRNRLDDQPDELRKLLSIPGCGFSWEEIRRIRPYTVNFNPAVEEQLRQPARPSV